MIDKPISEIQQGDLEALVENAVRERKRLEFKLCLPGNSDRDKKELLADVCSLVNTAGGDLVYGVGADDGVAVDLIGLENFSEDQQRLRLESTIRDGISPRVLGLEMQVVTGFRQGPILIIRVPPSWNPPHMVTYKGSSRFWARSSAGKYQLDVDEIRTAASLSSSLSDRFADWRNERIGKILAAETPLPILDNGRVILHLASLGSFRTSVGLDLAEIRRSRAEPHPLGERYSDRRVNLDGLLTFVTPGGPERASRAYCQVFRNGRIEAVHSDVLLPDRTGRPKPLGIPSVWLEPAIVEATREYLTLLRRYCPGRPFAISLTLTGVKGAVMHSEPQVGGTAIDRDIVRLPDVLVQNDQTDIPAVLQPMFDSLWNAAGIIRSLNYSEEGRWLPGAKR